MLKRSLENICQVKTHNGQLSVYVCVCVVRERGDGMLKGEGESVLFLLGQSLHQIVSDGAWCLQHSIKQSINIATQLNSVNVAYRLHIHVQH